MSRSTVILMTAAGQVPIPDDMQDIQAGQRVAIAACDSVATATLTASLNTDAFISPGTVVNIEAATDRITRDDFLGQKLAQGKKRLSATAGGTAAGLRVLIHILDPGDVWPFF